MVRLFVRDNLSGDVHEYGDDSHDSLILSEDGSLHYYNLHNGTGTMFSEEGYSFCLADGSDPRLCEDYIEYGVEPYINIGGETMNDDLISRQAAIDVIQLLPQLRTEDNILGGLTHEQNRH